jgi:hypothetical protein
MAHLIGEGNIGLYASDTTGPTIPTLNLNAVAQLSTVQLRLLSHTDVNSIYLSLAKTPPQSSRNNWAMLEMS